MSLKTLVEKEYKKLVPPEILDITKNKYKIIIGREYTNEFILDVQVEDKVILSLKYECLGVYQRPCNLFQWANKMDLLHKMSVNKTKSITKYKEQVKDYIINNKYTDSEYLERILYYLSNNIFFIEESNMTDLIKLCVYISKCKGILKHEQDANCIYYAITDIIGR